MAEGKVKESGVQQDDRIDQHLRTLSEQQQEPLRHLRALLREVLTAGDETIKYRMPCFAVRGKGVAAFDAFKHHWSYFPMSGSVLDKVDGLPSWVERDRGTLRVPLDKRLSKLVVQRLVRVRLDEISDVVDGKRFDFYSDGSVKGEGLMRHGRLHGSWTWWRQDGTLMRTGRFVDGEQTGVWATWGRSGKLVKETHF